MLASKVEKIKPKHLTIRWKLSDLVQRFPELAERLPFTEVATPGIEVEWCSDPELKAWGMWVDGKMIAPVDLNIDWQRDLLPLVSHPLLRPLKKLLSSGPVLLVDATAGLLGDSMLWHRLLQICIRSGPPELAVNATQSQILLFERQSALKWWYELTKLHAPHWPATVEISPLTDFDPLCAEMIQLLESWPGKKMLFYDPMFEYHRQKSLPNLQIQVLRHLTQSPQPEFTFAQWKKCLELFDVAVVKRTRKAPFLLDDAPHYQLKSLLLRWDIY